VRFKALTIATFGAILWITGCKVPSTEQIINTGLDVITIYQYAEPFITAAVEELKPTPTFGISHPIKDYFVLASSPNCDAIIDRFDNFDPFQSIICSFTDATVRYDNWFIVTTMEEFHKEVLAGTSVTKNTTWSDNGSPEVPRGYFYEFIDSDGTANIVWTVNTGLPFVHLSGWAKRADSNQEALYDWWTVTGSNHN